MCVHVLETACYKLRRNKLNFKIHDSPRFVNAKIYTQLHLKCDTNNNYFRSTDLTRTCEVGLLQVEI